MALKANQIRLVAGDTLPALRGTLTENDGITPIDLTGASVALHIKYDTPLEKAATIAAPTTGVYTVSWETGDLLEGTWPYEIQVTDSAGKIRTWNRESTTDKLMQMLIDAEVA